MKRLLTVLLAGLWLGLTACQGIGGPELLRPATGIDRILASGVLRVGLSANQPPLNVKNKGGRVIGLEVELVQALARSMGVQARFIETPFAELLDALENDEFDMAISGMTITPERNARVAFAGPYLISGKSLLTKSEEMANAAGPGELDDSRFKYAALSGSTSEEFVKGMLSSAELRATSDYDTAVKMVIDDEVDALIADFPICTLSVLRYPDAGLYLHRAPFTIEPLGIALPPDDPLLVNLVENYLHTLEDTGVLTRLKAKWFSPGDWIADLP